MSYQESRDSSSVVAGSLTDAKKSRFTALSPASFSLQKHRSLERHSHTISCCASWITREARRCSCSVHARLDRGVSRLFSMLLWSWPSKTRCSIFLRAYISASDSSTRNGPTKGRSFDRNNPWLESSEQVAEI